MVLLATFSSIALTAGLAVASVIPKTSPRPGLVTKRDEGDCSQGPWVGYQFTGGYQDGDTDFCETLYPTYAYPINQITIYSGPQLVRGLQFGYVDGTQSQLYGTDSGDGVAAQSMTVNYAGGETITTAALFAQDGAQYLRGLTIETSAGQVVHGGVTKDSGVPYVLQDVGAGLLIGAVGDYQPGVIDNLGLLFLNSPVASVTVANLAFPNGPAGAQGIAPDSLAAQHFYNGDTADENWSFMGSKAVTSTTTYSQTTTNTYASTASFEISAKIFIITGSETTSFTWTNADATMNGKTNTETDTLTWQQSGTLSPGEGLTCDALSGHGTGAFPFTSTVTVVLESGETWAQYQEGGTVNLDVVSSNSVVCNPDNSP